MRRRYTTTVGGAMISARIGIGRRGLGRAIRGIGLAAFSLIATSPISQANQCFTNGPRYKLEADTVDWQMTVHNSENCLRGVRFSYVYNATVSLGTPPKSGNVTIVGPGFSYTADNNFQGEDSFVVVVAGSKSKTTGYSKIHVIVSVVGKADMTKPTFARFEER
jgi:hypothetical protein